jgi:hypothetical protein
MFAILRRSFPRLSPSPPITCHSRSDAPLQHQLARVARCCWPLRDRSPFASRRVREAMAVTTYGIGYAPCRAFIREATELTPLGDLKLRSSQAESPRHYLAQADISRGPASTEPVARPHVATLTATIPWPRSNMIIWATIDVRCGHRRVAPTYRLTGYRGEDDRNHGFASLGTLRNGNGLRCRRCGAYSFREGAPG